MNFPSFLNGIVLGQKFSLGPLSLFRNLEHEEGIEAIYRF